MLKVNPRNAGFSLIEMMVAVTILILAMTGITAMMIMNAQSKKVASGTDEAATLAQSTVEQMLNIPFAELGTGTTSPSAVGLSGGTVDSYGPINRLGLLSSDLGAQGPYLYMRHSVVCTEGLTIAAGASPNPCAPAISASVRPVELSCGSYTLNAREKMIRTLISWIDKNGRCRYVALDAMSFNWAGI